MLNNAGDGVEGEGIGEDLVARLDAHDVERDEHRRTTGIGANSMLHTHVLSEGLFEIGSDGGFL